MIGHKSEKIWQRFILSNVKSSFSWWHGENVENVDNFCNVYNTVEIKKGMLKLYLMLSDLL